jgi:hypothetical protein
MEQGVTQFLSTQPVVVCQFTGGDADRADADTRQQLGMTLNRRTFAPYERASSWPDHVVEKPSFSASRHSAYHDRKGRSPNVNGRRNPVPILRPSNSPYWMSLQEKLFHTTQIAGMLYSTAVHRTCGTMVKPPSPQIDTQARSGAASLAPRMPAAPNPMPENPQVLSMVCGWRASQNCMNQLWCTPESSEMMASSGSTARQLATTRSGRSGEVWIWKLGAVKSCHSRRQPAIS